MITCPDCGGLGQIQITPTSVPSLPEWEWETCSHCDGEGCVTAGMAETEYSILRDQRNAAWLAEDDPFEAYDIWLQWYRTVRPDCDKPDHDLVWLYGDDLTLPTTHNERWPCDMIWLEAAP